MNIKNLFKKPLKGLKTPHINLEPSYQNYVPNAISFSQVKSALNAESLSEVIACFEHFKRFDTQIASELNKRRSNLIGKPIVVQSDDKAQDIFLQELSKSRNFRKFLYECSSAIAYGFASFIINYRQENSRIYPQFEFISPRYFECDNNYKPYVSQGGNKIYLKDNTDIWTHYHPTDTGNIIEQSLIYKIISIASLKHISLMKYMSYLDSYAIPPLIIKSDSLSNEEDSKAILKSALALRSNSVGLFGANDMVEVVNGNVDKGTFLEFVRYCDESISKLITGQVLSSNSTQNGTQALGNIHNEMQKNATEFDALLLSESLHSLLKQVLEFNFAAPAPFSFEIDTNTEKDEKLQADTYLILSQMGVKIPIEHLEKTFKISHLSYADSTQTSHNLSFNKAQDLLTGQELEIDKALQDVNPKSEFDLGAFLKDCKSYEQAAQKIALSFKGEDLLLKEQELMRLFLNGALFGADDVTL